MKLFDNCIEGIELETWERFLVGDHVIQVDATLPFIPGNFARGRLLRASISTTPEKTFLLSSQGQHHDSSGLALVRVRLNDFLGPNQICRIIDPTMLSAVLICQSFAVSAFKRLGSVSSRLFFGSLGVHALIVLSPGASISFCETISDRPSECQQALLQARGKELINISVLEKRVSYDGDSVKVLTYRHRLIKPNNDKSFAAD